MQIDEVQGRMRWPKLAAGQSKGTAGCGFSRIPILGEALSGHGGLDSSGLQLCVWFKGQTAFSVLKVTSDLWPKGWLDSCPGQAPPREGWVSRPWFELRVLKPEGEPRSSWPHPKALGVLFSSPPLLPPDSRRMGGSYMRIHCPQEGACG